MNVIEIIGLVNAIKAWRCIDAAMTPYQFLMDTLLEFSGLLHLEPAFLLFQQALQNAEEDEDWRFLGITEADHAHNRFQFSIRIIKKNDDRRFSFWILRDPYPLYPWLILDHEGNIIGNTCGSAEEWRSNPAMGTLDRFLRFMGAF
jgi:hypothetical protein